MTFGPFPVHFVNVLRQKLQAQGRDLHILSATEEIEKFQKSNQHQQPTSLPAYGTAPDLIYVEIEQTDLLIVKADLERMGASLVERTFDPEFGRGEYLCPRCDFVSESQALCPKHKIPLLEFSAYAEAKRQRAAKIERYISIALLVLGAIVGLIYTIQKSTSPF